MPPATIRRIAFVGIGAYTVRLEDELRIPIRAPSCSRFVIIVRQDHDIEKLYGIAPETIRYVDLGVTHFQFVMLQSRGLSSIAMAEAKEWLQAKTGLKD